jgi:hypothetical protein
MRFKAFTYFPGTQSVFSVDLVRHLKEAEILLWMPYFVWFSNIIMGSSADPINSNGSDEMNGFLIIHF